MDDLTKLRIFNADGPDEPQKDFGTTSIAKVEVVFRNHRQRLLEEIEKYPVVIGCVAWLTDRPVLHALATKDYVGIIVQKEDFLRPDSAGSSTGLRKLYDGMPRCGRAESRFTSGYSFCGGNNSDAIRCVGNHNSQRKTAFPRMHNKFLVFCSVQERDEPDAMYPTHHPEKVWTGSYNISDNATRSWENAVIIDDPAIAEAYAEEYGQIYGLSEALDWTSAWVEPEYRIGS